MKTLLLLRHAKSSWKDSDVEDHERPLNKRGKKEAPKMGRLLRDESLLPDLIVCSSAKRCRKTAEDVIHASGYRGETRISGELYEADAAKLQEFLGKLDGSLVTVLLIAHNLGIEEFLEPLVAVHATIDSRVAQQLSVDRWGDLSPDTRGELVKVWQPRGWKNSAPIDMMG
jgi:phosphohistidine phosphatase